MFFCARVQGGGVTPTMSGNKQNKFRFWVVHIPGAEGASGVGATCRRSRRGPEDHVTRGSVLGMKR